MRNKFWLLPLEELDSEEWEALCDGCGKCCVVKLEDEDTGELFYTDVACSLLDHQTCRCTDYAHRQQCVPECINLHGNDEYVFDWLPLTCAYRLRKAGQKLFDWHPLLTNDPHSVHHASISVQGKLVSQDDVSDLEDHITFWD